jgi:hypothetical protein
MPKKQRSKKYCGTFPLNNALLTKQSAHVAGPQQENGHSKGCIDHRHCKGTIFFLLSLFN